MKKFYRDQVVKEINAIKNGTLDIKDSEVAQEWLELSQNWFDDMNEIQLDGFVGFKDRSALAILLDFHYNNRLWEHLTESEIMDYISELAKRTD